MNTYEFLIPSDLDLIKHSKAAFDGVIQLVKSRYAMGQEDQIMVDGRIVRAEIAKATEDASECQDEPSVGDKVEI